MKIEQFTVFSGVVTKIGDIVPETKFMYVQNNNVTNFMVVGTNNSLTLSTGYKIVPGDTFPVPLDGNTTEVFALASIADINETIVVQG